MSTKKVPITIRMPKKHLKKWLKALRSGKYKQGKGALKTDDGAYCCLGVLQMVVSGNVEMTPAFPGAKSWAKGAPSMDWCDTHKIEFKYKDANTYMPELPTLANTHQYYGTVSAAQANDCLGCSFLEIADAIEACSEGF